MKGFFTFALCMSMAIMLLFAYAAAEKNNYKLEKTKTELIAAENANMQRTLLENNTDKIILLKLQEEIVKENFNTHSLQEEINKALSSYLKNKTNARTIFNETIGEITLEFLNQNSSVMMLEIKGVTYAEYVFTGGTLKNTTVGKKFGNKIVSSFVIPAESTTRIIR
jgi:hypothetical protein